MSRSVVTEIQINAEPSRVWKEFSNFDSFPDWSPFIREIRGSMEKGSRLEVALQPPGNKARVLNPVVLRSEPLEEFRWRGKMGPGGVLFSGEHFFRLMPRDDHEGTVFTHGETFRGMLLPLLWRSLNTDVRRGFVAFNQALKARCESGSPETGADRGGKV